MFNRIRNLFLAAIGATAIIIIFGTACSDAYSDMSSDKRFQYAMKTIIKQEGGLSDNPNDPGSITKYGISLRYLKSAHLCIDGDCRDDANEIIHLTLTEADGVYYRQWYEHYGYNRIKNEDILTDIMSFSINAGACEAHKLAERAINDITTDGIPVSCALTQKAIDIINLIEPVVFHAAFQQEEDSFYKQIVKRNRHLKVFLKGWEKRIGI